MQRFIRCSSCLVALVLLPGSSVAREPTAHVHGVASLQVAVDGKTLSLIFESPLHNLLGFEHPPRTDAEQVSVRALRERLRKPESLFAPTNAARCAVTSAKVDSPVFDPQPATGERSGHGDLDAEFIFTCERPDELHGLEARLFDAFRGLVRLDVQVATPRGQAAKNLTRSNRVVSW